MSNGLYYVAHGVNNLLCVTDFLDESTMRSLRRVFGKMGANTQTTTVIT